MEQLRTSRGGVANSHGRESQYLVDDVVYVANGPRCRVSVWAVVKRDRHTRSVTGLIQLQLTQCVDHPGAVNLFKNHALRGSLALNIMGRVKTNPSGFMIPDADKNNCVLLPACYI